MLNIPNFNKQANIQLMKARMSEDLSIHVKLFTTGRCQGFLLKQNTGLLCPG